ncbi:MAG: metallophosphoesterase family protein [Treponema sp.]
MKLLVISDGHGAIDNLSALSTIAKDVDLILFAGDFAAFNQAHTGLPFLKKLCSLHKNIYSVLGNCDHPSFIEELKIHNINMQATNTHFEEFVLLGSGGASKFTGTTPNERTDEELASDITSHYNENQGDNIILVTHNPPHGAKTDKVAPLVHVGSKLIRKFIEEKKPIIAISGHIHEAFGVDNIGQTLLLNPGALCDGRFAIAEITKENGKYKANAILKTI